MKNLSIIIFITIYGNLFAQSLEVTYVEKTDLSSQLAQITDPRIRMMVQNKLPKEKLYLLSYYGNKSLYKGIRKKEGGHENAGKVYVSGGGQIVYKDLGKKQLIKQTDFLGRTFLISDTLPAFKWHITSDTMHIGHYVCRKATAVFKDKRIEAWFTADIPVSDGPAIYWGLPGLILRIKAGNTIIEATEIKFSRQPLVIQAPRKGKKVTGREFQKIREEKIKALTGNGGDNGSKIKVIHM